MRDRVEVLRQISIDHIRVAPAQQPVHFLDRGRSTTTGTIAIGAVFQVCFKDRLQHQLRRGLNHPIPDRGDAERAFSASRLRDQHTPHRCRTIRLRGQLLSQTRQPFCFARRRNRREAFSVNSRCSCIGAGQHIGVAQNVFSTDLVVEQVEAEGGLCLRLAIQLPLKAPDPFRCFKAHRQSPDPHPLPQRSRSQGPSLHQSYPASSVLRPCPTPAPAAALRDVEAATLATAGLPRCLHPLSNVPFPLPRRNGQVRASIASPSVLPSPYRWRVGFRIFTFEACSGFTLLRPAGLLSRPRRPLSRGFRAAVTQPPCSPATRPLDNYLGGFLLHW